MSKLDNTKIFVKGAKPTSIGGQAIMEGVMMQGPDRIALAMRLPTDEIYLKTTKKKAQSKYSRIPLLRGVIAFVKSFLTGMNTLLESADILEEYLPEDEKETESKWEKKLNEKFGPKASWNLMMFGSVAMALLVTIVVFILMPTFVVNYLSDYISSAFILNLIEGLLRIVMFLAYIIAISRMKEIHTLFQYHGAEHKTIHCFENGAELTPANADKFYRLHPRCGTSFLVFVLIISLLLFSLLGWPNLVMRFLSRILLIPVIAGISYELLSWAGRSDNTCIRLLSYPGIMLQKLTTAEPTRDQLEIAIIALEAVLADPSISDVDGIFTPKSKAAESEDEETHVEEDKPSGPRYSDSPDSVGNILKWAENELADIENGRGDAFTLLSYISGMSRSDMILRKDEILGEDETIEYRKVVNERLSGTPLQYITKVQEFMGYPFRVSPAVLIPRLDTEVLADKVINVIKGLGLSRPDVLDICTGSGVLGVTIAKEIPEADVTLTDRSSDALNVAISNSQLNDVFGRCSFALGDMFDAVSEDARFDVIVSNPPYIESAEIEKLDAEVRDHEPRMALDGGPDGLYFYRRIAADAGKHLCSGGILALEIGCNQGESVKGLLEATGEYVAVSVLKDLNGLDRVVIAGKR